MQRLMDLKKRLEVPAPPEEYSDDWYAGLSAEPTRFTQQLMNLQESLRAAGQPAPVLKREGAATD